MKTLILILTAMVVMAETPKATEKELLQEVQIAQLRAELSVARHAQARQIIVELERENTAANQAIAAAKKSACVHAGGKSAEDCDYDLTAWKVSLKKKEPK